MRPSGGTVNLVERGDGTIVEPPIVMPVIGNVTVRHEWANDYYVWCASSVLTPRLFVDFDADACLIIHDPMAFQQRIAWALGMELRDIQPPLQGLSVLANRIGYYDPYDPPPRRESIQVPWHKPFQFLYQREWRLISLLVPPRSEDLPVIHVHPGPLTDIAELFYIGELEGWRFPSRNAIVRSP